LKLVSTSIPTNHSPTLSIEISFSDDEAQIGFSALSQLFDIVISLCYIPVYSQRTLPISAAAATTTAAAAAAGWNTVCP
jgi:hypothetical protein